ncbi:MAG: transcriptional regulator, partial [Rhodanobacteraceae bacterium]
MSAMEKPVYHFGEFELDPDERRLLQHGEPVTLTPKVFDTLVLLVERAGRAVSKDELMHALWPRGFVDESNLTKHIWLIRKALDGAGHNAHCIETVSKLGYRFIAPVQRVAHGDRAANRTASSAFRSGSPTSTPPLPSRPPPASPMTAEEPERFPDRDGDRRLASAQNAAPATAPLVPRMPHVLIALAILAVVVVVLAFLHDRSHEAPLQPPGAPPGTAIAIVAFNNLSQNAKDAWLGPALGEMLATEIATSDRLHAMPDELVRPARAD